MKKLFLILLLLAQPAFAAPISSGVQQSGTVTATHCASWSSNYTIQDSGAPCGGTQTYPTAGVAVSTGSAWGTSLGYGLTGNNVLLETNSSGLISSAVVPVLNQNTTGTASNITATSNSTLTTLPNVTSVGGVIGIGTTGIASSSYVFQAPMVVSIGTQNNSIVDNPKYVPQNQSLQRYGPLYPTLDTTGLTSTIGTSAVAVGSSNPLVIPTPGNYYLQASVNTALAGASFSTVQSVTCQLWRTNNTAVALSIPYSVAIPITPAVTVSNSTINIAPFLYATGNYTDSINLYCSLSALPLVGSVQVTATHITALRQ